MQYFCVGTVVSLSALCGCFTAAGGDDWTSKKHTFPIYLSTRYSALSTLPSGSRCLATASGLYETRTAPSLLAL